MFIDIPYNIVLEICNRTSKTDLKVLLNECAGIDTSGPNPLHHGYSSLVLEITTGAYQEQLWRLLQVDNSTQYTIRQLVLSGLLKNIAQPFFKTGSMRNSTCDVLAPLLEQIFSSDGRRTSMLAMLGAVSTDPKDPIYYTGLYEILGDNYMTMEDLRLASILDVAGLLRLRKVPNKQKVVSKLSHTINRCQKRSIFFEDESYDFGSMSPRKLYQECDIHLIYLQMAIGDWRLSLPFGMSLRDMDNQTLKNMDIFSLVYRSSIFSDQLVRRDHMTIQELATSVGMDKETALSRPIREVGPKLLSVSEEVLMEYLDLYNSDVFNNASQSIRDFGKGLISKDYNDGMMLMRRFSDLGNPLAQEINVNRLMSLPLKHVFNVVGQSIDNATSKTIYEFMMDHFGLNQTDSQKLLNKVASTDGAHLHNLTIRVLLQVSRRVQPDGDVDLVNFYRLHKASDVFNYVLQPLVTPIHNINETAGSLSEILASFPNNATGELVTKFFESYYGEPYGKKEFVKALINTPFKEMAPKLMTTEAALKVFEVIALADAFEISKSPLLSFFTGD